MISNAGFLRFCALVILSCLPAGCSQDLQPADFSGHKPIVRVLVFQGRSSVQLSASQPPTIRTSSIPSPRRLDILPGENLVLGLTPTGWRLGNVVVGTGELQIQPAAEGSVRVDGQPYRGRYRLVPTGPDKFDVVNDVDVDGYLKGVVPRELKRLWSEETYKAQAVVARTYAMYELKAASASSHYDLFNDQRSQVYGGIAAETAVARQAVDATSGVVVTSGPPGHERIFKAYFSSCCGGIGQNAADAFGDPPSAPLMEQAVGNLCSQSPHFNWGPVVVSKVELTRRFRRFGQLRNRAEKDMAPLSRIEVAMKNSLGRPVRFTAIDTRGAKYFWTGEEMRWAVDTDAGDSTKLISSFFEIDNSQPGVIRFFNGHGFGHGVGMCQWCAERRAELGMRYDAIVLAAYPNSKLLKAY